MLIASLVLLTLVLIASIFHKINIPVIILSLTIGIIFGSDVTGLIYFDNTVFAKEVANIALMFILFIGGFGTKKQSFRSVLRPVSLLATVGIVTTALITGFVFHLLVPKVPFLYALLLGSILASTDAAAVFSILKGKNVEPKLRTLTELESVANDPMAIVLTLFVIGLIQGAQSGILSSILNFLWQLAGGIGIGIGIGWLAVYVMKKVRQSEAEYFIIYMIAVVLFSYSIANVSRASGMLSVFFTGFVMGNQNIPYKKGLLSFNNIISFITNVGLFILLGLLVFPHNFAKIWGNGILIFLILSLVSRPITVFLLTWFCDIGLKEKTFLIAAGIKGSVPIVLATYPSAMGLDPDHEIFNIVFFVVTLSVVIQGTSLIPLARKLNLLVKDRRKTYKIVDLVTVTDTNFELVEVYIDEDYYEGSCRVADMELPPGTLITLVKREGQVISPQGSTEVFPRDILTILVEKQYIEMIPIDILRSFVMKQLDNADKEKPSEA